MGVNRQLRTQEKSYVQRMIQEQLLDADSDSTEMPDDLSSLIIFDREEDRRSIIIDGFDPDTQKLYETVEDFDRAIDQISPFLGYDENEQIMSSRREIQKQQDAREGQDYWLQVIDYDDYLL
jgi:hypothetical protein